MALEMDDGIVPLGMLLAIFVRWGVSLYPHSGQDTPPMYGDYEAQRHWQEITWNLPVKQWYVNSSRNDLLYWGLDYPPLTAYHSYVLGMIAHKINPAWVKLFSSRGTENQSHKLFMRYSVFVADVLIYMTAVCAYWLYAHKNLKQKSCAVAVMLLYPGLILIDHGHFQYNCVSLGLTLWAIVALKCGYDYFGTVAFCFALNYKQMELYHALPFFCYLLGLCFKIQPLKGFFRVLKLAVIVIASLYVCWYPFSGSLTQFQHVFRRLFPFNRGLFEDKVANLWCVLSIIVKLKEIFSVPTLVKISFATTVTALIPSSLNLVLNPSIHRFKLSLVNMSLIFYLCSYQVHEKSILLVALPVCCLLPVYSLPSIWFLLISTFSMFPLLLKDRLTLPYFATNFIFIILASNAFLRSSSLHEVKNSRHFVKLTFYISIIGAILLNFAHLLIPPPEKYPDVHALICCSYSFIHFVGFLLYFQWKQFTCSDIWTTKKRQ